jgi:hypothetical protein
MHVTSRPCICNTLTSSLSLEVIMRYNLPLEAHDHPGQVQLEQLVQAQAAHRCTVWIYAGHRHHDIMLLHNNCWLFHIEIWAAHCLESGSMLGIAVMTSCCHRMIAGCFIYHLSMHDRSEFSEIHIWSYSPDIAKLAISQLLYRPDINWWCRRWRLVWLE